MGAQFDTSYKQYEFEDDLIFLRDVDEHPIVMKESELMEGDWVKQKWGWGD